MRFAILAVMLFTGLAGAQELDRNQAAAVGRQESNLKEAQKKLKDMQDAYEKDMAGLSAPDTLIPPAFFKGYMAKGDEVLQKCTAMMSDLDKNKCPADNARVRVITEWIADAKKAITKLNEEMAPKLAAMEKLLDPKNYPTLDADFSQMETIARAYAFKGFKTNPDKVAELAKEFPRAIKWGSDKFKEYRPIIVLSGGDKSPLYKKYEAMAKSIKAFQAEATEFFKKAQEEVPGFLKKAEEMATQAASEKKPAFITGGVKQQFDWADADLKVCRALVPADDERLKAMESAYAESRKKVDAQAATLKELILAEERPPAEKYKGADLEALRKQILAEWKKEWPKDEVLMVRFHMENFDRRETATWDEGSKSWSFDDRSVLCVTVIVKTSDKIATSYPAYINVDNIAKTTTFGVKTKGGVYVNEEMLVENVK